MNNIPRNKVVILLLSFERYELMARAVAANIKNAGVSVDVIALDQGSKDPRVMEYLNTVCDQVYQSKNNIGIAEGLNFLLKKAMDQGYTYFQFMANDIVEQYNWIANKIVAYVWREGKPYGVRHGMLSTYPGNGPIPSEPCHVIGQFMLTRDIVEKVGYFKNFGTLYAPIDNDYNVRCEKMGFQNRYLYDLRSTHIDRNDEIYGYDKAAQIKQTWPVHEADSEKYTAENAFIDYQDGGYNINMVDAIQ